MAKLTIAALLFPTNSDYQKKTKNHSPKDCLENIIMNETNNKKVQVKMKKYKKKYNRFFVERRTIHQLLVSDG